MRRKDREITDINVILELVARTDVLHLGLNDGDYPYVVPLHYGYEYANGKLTFYMHGAKEGHKIDLINADPKVCVELENDVELIPGDVACAYGSSYSSVIGRGTASIVTDEEEKIKGLKLLMENQTGRAFDIDARMASAVAVIKVELDSFTAKARKKMPH